MKMIKSAIITVFIATSFFTIGSVAAERQQSCRPENKIFQIKKIQMLDELQLSDEQADKFLLTYNSWERQIDTARSKVDSARKELDNIFSDTVNTYSDSQYSKKAENFLNCLHNMQNLIDKRNLAIKEILPGKTYARYVLFEEHFMFDLQKKFMRASRRDSDDPDFRNPPPMNDRRECKFRNSKGNPNNDDKHPELTE